MDKTNKITTTTEVPSFLDLMKELETRDLNTNVNANGKITIQQTQRNALRKELVDAFFNFLLDQGIDAYLTNDGIIMAVENEHIGTISIETKLAFKALDYNPADEADLYEDELASKAEEKANKAKIKVKRVIGQ
ncbi:hypothetical protein EOM81_01745 [bacterium]|nr:hypothetical protein [bacterium]